MPEPTNIANRFDSIRVFFFRMAASGLLPAHWFEDRIPVASSRARKTGELQIELVSHCWGYAHLLIFQLSSLVRYPPTQCNITMTVYYSEEDDRTVEVLNYFESLTVPNVIWNWQPLHKYQLFRRSIGRNQAALTTKADWIWFTDCDLLFNAHCLDSLCTQLQGSSETLAFPLEERTSMLLTADNPVLNLSQRQVSVRPINPLEFETHQRTRATGPLQITHGDVARACGYCDAIEVLQKPADHWCKAHEDRIFRWLLGSNGIGLPILNVYRIRHLEKGRYRKNTISAALRRRIRQIQSVLRGD